MPSSLHVSRRGPVVLSLLALSLASLLPALALAAGPVTARRKQEPMHRLLTMKDASGKLLANGEDVAVLQGDEVHARLTFHYLDGSVDDEETVFKQDSAFHLISDHHIQKGPTFPAPVDIAVDVPSGTVTWHEMRAGKDETRTQTLAVPDDVANGIVPLLVENYPLGAAEMRVSWMAIAFKPMFVGLSVAPKGAEEVDPGGTFVRANEYVIHAQVPGMIGMLAPLVNKLPADIHIWVTDEKKPAFVRLDSQFYPGGPMWTVEPAGPPSSE